MLLPKLMVTQDIQIEATEEGHYAVFMTNLYYDYLNKIENQSYDLKRKLSDSQTNAKYRAGSGFNDSFFKVVLSEKKEDIFKPERGINLKIAYNIDETGNNVFSCALYFPKEHVFLSASEIQAVLVEAMNHKFDYTNKPIGESKFYFTVNCFYNKEF
jgi:hypothetical protein